MGRTFWYCRRCGRLHRHNTTACLRCDHTVFEPASASEVESMATGIEAPEPLDLETPPRTVGTGGDNSPDVAPDGSLEESPIEAVLESDGSPESRSLFQRVKRRLPFL